jgi:hypothetical protein
MARDVDDDRVRDYLRLLGNPYASLQVRDLPQREEVSECREAAFTVNPEQLRFSALAPAVLREPSHGNPYASLANLDDEGDFSAKAVATVESVAEISISSFEAGCRRIFVQYIPAPERGRLRPEHRDFIERNKLSSSQIRARLLAALQRFDLSGLVVQPQFNREHPDLTAKKLLEIERSVGKDS